MLTNLDQGVKDPPGGVSVDERLEALEPWASDENLNFQIAGMDILLTGIIK